jgi:acid phosphatase (class A)
MQRRFVSSIVLISFSALLSLGASEEKLHFLAPDAVNVVQLLPDPPDKDSREYRDEIDLMLNVQQTRTDAEIARGKSESKFDVFAFGDVLGPWFTAERCPQAAKFFKDISGDAKYFTSEGKDHWNRPRPPRSDDRIKPMLEEKDASYPSGHSTRATVMGEILAEIFPQQREALLARGRQIGWDRVIVGVHFPSDVDAGRVLGHAIAHQLLASPEFREELDKIKTELNEAAGVHTSAATP